MTDSIQSPAGRPSFPRLFWAMFLAAAVAHALLYGHLIARATFLNDDWFLVEPIPIERLPHLLTGDWYQGYSGIGGFFRPLPRLLAQVMGLAFGLRPVPYLLISSVVHLFNCALLFLLTFRVTQGNRAAAVVAALAFAVYPTHFEAVLQLSTWTDLLAVCGYLAALNSVWLLRESAAPRNWLAALGGALVGALSKESWITLPLTVLWLEGLYPARSSRRGQAGETAYSPCELHSATDGAQERMAVWPDRSAWLRIGAFFFLAFVYAAYRLAILGGIGGYGNELTFSTARQTYDSVFRMIVLPFLESEKWNDLFSVYLLLGAILIAWALAGWPRLMAFGIGWMVLTTLPCLTLSPRLHDGGRLVYIVTIGWTLFLAALYDKVMHAGTTTGARGRLAFAAAVCLFGPLAAIHIAHGLDWRRAFAENRRLIGEMAAFAGGQPADARYAVLAWPSRHGVAISNRPDTAAKALSILAGIPAAQSDGLLAPDAPRGTFTFEVVEKWQERRRRPKLKLRIGRIEAVEHRRWTGREMEQWQPWQNAQLARLRSDGARDYWFLDRSAGLLSPALDMAGGYYSVQFRYDPVRLYWGFVMWRDGPEGFDPARMTALKPLGRLGRQTQVACLGRLASLRQILFLPSQSRCLLTVHSIELARFEIAPVL